MFKSNNDTKNDIIIKLYKNKLYGKYDILNDVLSRNEYIYKDVAIDEIDSNIIPNMQRRESDMNNVYDICFNTNSKMPFCKTLKEEFKSLDNVNIINNTQKQNIIQKKNNRNYYSEYYNNKI